MLDFNRIAMLVRPLGFAATIDSHRLRWTYVRKDPQCDVFHKIQVESCGRRGEAVVGSVLVSLTKNINFWKGKYLSVQEVVGELATDTHRGLATIRSVDEAIAWEKRFATLAPDRAARCARQHAKQLLVGAARAQAAAAKYLSTLPDLESPFAVRSYLTKSSSPEMTAAALRLAAWPTVMRLAGTEELYEVACLCIASRCGSVEGQSQQFSISLPPAQPDEDWRQQSDPIHNQALMCRIQLLADKLIDKWNSVPDSGIAVNWEDRRGRGP